ncbi:cupin domain-containing protein [Caballeronia pedi]|uniref:cupin domain-containing protein n=1 Tax=Caballeronia pedi TaxID=1777141 RepID=UPI00142D82BE|nr:cupin domain-containing protein [Caballeronia pedi]
MENGPIVYSYGKHDFSDWKDVAEPIGSLVSMTRAAEAMEAHDRAVSMGIWECSRGVWRRQVLAAEFSYILRGHCFFTPDGMTPVELRAGDSVYFPSNCVGTWDIREDLAKSYFIVSS